MIDPIRLGTDLRDMIKINKKVNNLFPRVPVRATLGEIFGSCIDDYIDDRMTAWFPFVRRRDNFNTDTLFSHLTKFISNIEVKFILKSKDNYNGVRCRDLLEYFLARFYLVLDNEKVVKEVGSLCSGAKYSCESTFFQQDNNIFLLSKKSMSSFMLGGVIHSVYCKEVSSVKSSVLCISGPKSMLDDDRPPTKYFARGMRIDAIDEGLTEPVKFLLDPSKASMSLDLNLVTKSDYEYPPRRLNFKQIKRILNG